MERDERESAGIARSQHMVYTMPQDWASVAQLLQPALERVDPSVAETQLLVVTADVETAITVAAAAVRLQGDRGIEVLPATGARRAARVLKARAAHVVVGAPAELLALVRATALKLEHVRSVLIAWLDDVHAAGGMPELETIMGELPKDAARVLVTAQLGPEVEEFAERYVRRAPHPSEQREEAIPGPALQYVSVSAASRPAALRRVLDELDPASAAVYVRAPESEEEARRTLATLGYAAEGGPVRIVRDADQGADAALVILYDVPPTRQELRAIAGTSGRPLVALAQPRQLATLRALSSGVTPLVLPGPATRARSREEALRAELREALAAGMPARELLAIEPLLAEFDGVELAAAALRLLETERARAASAGIAAPAAAPTAEGMTRLFVNIGSRDGARPGDLVGAVLGETGLSREAIGRIDLRENFTIVEVAAAHADTVVDKLTGASIRGRRVVARVDRAPAAERPERAPRERAPRERAPRDRGPREYTPRERGPREFGSRERGPRDFGSRDRGPRDRGPRDERRPAPRTPRTPRPPRDRE